MNPDNEMIWRDEALKADTLICELQHRIGELQADNEAMRVELWAKDRVITLLVERLATEEAK